nr:cytochrome P450-terp-like [Nerophis lumbriciformis]
MSTQEPLDLFTNNHRWGDLDDWNRAAVALHAEGPLHRVEADGFDPFWAVIDHAAVLEIERQPGRHGDYRRLTNDWFKPASVRRLNDRLAELSRQALATLQAADGACDFASEIALPYPLQVILNILGLPESDYPRMLQLTQHLFGGEDPDLQREPPSPEVLNQVIADFFAYFTGLTAERRGNPTDDLASVIANGQIDGAAMPDLETLGYYIIVATAGHDTTSSAMSGGMQALIDHPEQFELLKAQPELLNNAVEEMIRWTAPVRHFMRTATADTEVAGHRIKKGEWLYLSYKAANLDPKVFEDPLRFDIERSNADRNISFGYGVHFCLGAQLARNEIRASSPRWCRALRRLLWTARHQP